MKTKPHAPDEQNRKKRRPGFKIGPDNLPDGTYRRKVIGIKRDLIYKAKLKKSYAKLKAREPITPSGIPTSQPQLEPEFKEPASQELHPDRQAMLDAPDKDIPPENSEARPQQRGRSRKPDYFEKQQEYAEQKRLETELRKEKFMQKEKERKQRLEERERFRRLMAKARSGGKNGQRKLGRESTVLLEKIKRNSIKN
ncbi:hypothetical protein K3495_g4825 [Podosphaera aphanis]|nr:hypothetical protein K3495_g4825 [Podosphaera aphanis]